MAAALAVASGVAAVVTKDCTGGLHANTNESGTVKDNAATDDKRGREGSDTALARANRDELVGGTGNDTLGGVGTTIPNIWEHPGQVSHPLRRRGSGVDTLDFSVLNVYVEEQRQLLAGLR